MIVLGRNQAIKVKKLFPQLEERECAVCQEEITDARKRRYCSEHCREVAYATQKFYLWKSVRKKILERDNWTCQRCGKSKEEMIQDYREENPEQVERFGDPDFDHKFHVDHIKPVSKGGKVFDWDNLQVLCEDCNLSKSDKYSGEKSIFDFYQMENRDKANGSTENDTR